MEWLRMSKEATIIGKWVYRQWLTISCEGSEIISFRYLFILLFFRSNTKISTNVGMIEVMLLVSSRKKLNWTDFPFLVKFKNWIY